MRPNPRAEMHNESLSAPKPVRAGMYISNRVMIEEIGVDEFNDKGWFAF